MMLVESAPQSTPIEVSILEHLLEGCQVVSFDYRYLYLNASALRHAGQLPDRLLGRTMSDCYPGIDETEMFAVLRRCMEARAHERMENRFVYPDGTVGWFLLRFVPVPEGVCILSLDITEEKRAEEIRRRTEERLKQVQKLEALGRLAGGVAHDFNNLLSVILSYARLIKDELRPEDPLRAEVEEIWLAGTRAAGVVRQLLACGGREAQPPRSVDLNQLVGDMERLLRRVLGEGIELSILTAQAVGRVHSDPGHLEQVIMNLVVNARDALTQGGTISVETADVHLDTQYASEHHGVTPGDYVMLAVSDTGSGMTKETQARIFEPFFTTKEVGKGTGLGLATVYGIAKQWGGHIWVYSEPGIGTTFKVYLPRNDRPTRAPTPLEDASNAMVGGTETVLLVEDEEQVRVLVRTVLRRAGYTVLEARNGGEALLICEQYPAKIHLLVSDLIMPRMSGRQLADRLAPQKPDMRVLFISGYTNGAAVQHGVMDGGVPFLQKPFTPRQLVQRVRAILDAAKG